MIRSCSKVRLGTRAMLAAMLLTAIASQSHAAVSMQGDDLQIAPSMVELAPGKLDAACAPPSDLGACAAWHQVIRANFSPREIGILFGTATSYPEYATSYARIKSRYERLQGEFSAERLPAHTAYVD
jgi:invasion protein IalB